MWFNFNDFGEIEDAYFITLGRALLVAQIYEDMCKRTLLWWDAAQRIAGEKKVDQDILERMAKYSDDYMEMFLGIALTKLVKGHKINHNDEQVLRNAKDARNYIAHKAGHPCFLLSKSSENIYGELPVLKQNIIMLSEGYNLLSCWAYEFEEGEPRPATISRVYPLELAQWVLSPVHEALYDY
jgi:hypothetical protein